MKRVHIFSLKDVEQPVRSTTQADAGSTTQAASGSASVRQPSQLAPKKKVRGPTMKKAIWNLKSHEKVVVTFNELAQPIGDEANELTKFLGTLVRMSQHIGINYKELRKVPDIKKEDLWSIVKVEAENKKRNRSKSDEPHITGSKSFARLCDETQKNDGVPPSRGGMYCLTRTYKDGSIVNAKAAKVVAEVKGIREDFMPLVSAVKEHIPGLNFSTIICRANTNMEGDDACNVPNSSLAHNPKNPRSTGASHHLNNSTSNATSAHSKNSRSNATRPHPKNPTSGTSSHPKNHTSGPRPRNPTSGNEDGLERRSSIRLELNLQTERNPEKKLDRGSD
ncbi:transposase, Ptta/En/Spm [Tanacetum coccineum]